MSISIKDLFVNYGRLEVLKGVSLEFKTSEINLLLGANGSGKSTLLKTISGLNPPISGSIWFEKKRLDTLSPDEILKAGIAHVPEGRRVYGNMTVLENLEMGAYSRRDKRQIKKDIDKTFERFPSLAQRRKENSSKLSGGQQQMLAIARSLMTRPKVILMDEPAQGLSPVIVDAVAKIITELNHNGLTILLVEHNLSLGLGLAHNVYVLENGKVAFKAKSTDLSGMEYATKIYLGG